ncbi:MAG: cupin domain-containing protein [Bacteroidota bacterium]
MSTLPDGPHSLAELATPADGAIVSRVLHKARGGSATAFAFAEGEGLDEHSTPHEALLLVTDGVAEVSIDGVSYRVAAGHILRLPASVPHAVRAMTAFQMLLILLRDAWS